MKKSKNSHCLCALAFLRRDVKIVARRASRVTHAVARNSVCFERAHFVFVCDIPRVASARGKGRTRSRVGRRFWTKLYCFRIRFLTCIFGLGSSPFLSVRFQINGTRSSTYFQSGFKSVITYPEYEFSITNVLTITPTFQTLVLVKLN